MRETDKKNGVDKKVLKLGRKKVQAGDSRTGRRCLRRAVCTASSRPVPSLSSSLQRGSSLPESAS